MQTRYSRIISCPRTFRENFEFEIYGLSIVVNKGTTLLFPISYGYPGYCGYPAVGVKDYISILNTYIDSGA